MSKLFASEDSEVFDVWSVREEVESFDGFDMVVFEEELDVTSLCGGITGKVNHGFRFNFIESID